MRGPGSQRRLHRLDPDVVRAFAQTAPEVRLLENPGNAAKATACAPDAPGAGDKVPFTDADLSAPHRGSRRLFAAIQQGADIAFGSRWLRATARLSAKPSTPILGDASTPSPLHHAPALRRHTVRLQGLHPPGCPDRLPQLQTIERWASTRRSCSSPQARFLDHRGPVTWAHDERSA